MNILIIGSGGREHALAWKIKESRHAKKIYCAPGNGGIAKIAECVDLAVEDIEGLIQFAKDKKIGLTVVGPEAPLVEGIVDEFEKEGLKIFGPHKFAAQLEGSKVFAKEFMHDCNIPTAQFKTFDDMDAAKDFLSKAQFPLVIKADGLAAGKGVFVCDDLNKGLEALKQIMEEKVFKDAGEKIVIEECLKGEEASILAISDGKNYVILEPSQDHKRIFDDDMGPNTGGMGAYCPTPVIDAKMIAKIESRVIDPAIRGMKRHGIPFKGVLYAGIMVTSEGPMVLEFNVRFGDPETQVVLPRLETDIIDVMLASIDGKLDKLNLSWDSRACVCVVISSGGYPGKYEKGLEIKGVAEAEKQPDTIVFHAGTQLEGDKLFTSGGRVFGVTGLGRNLEKAIKNTYQAVEKIHFDRCFFRRDIGAKAMAHLPETTTQR